MRPLHYAPYRAENPGGHILFSFIGLIFWVAIIVGIILLIKHYSHGHHSHWHTNQDPLEIAKARYARGEITKEEFTTLKKDLS